MYLSQSSTNFGIKRVIFTLTGLILRNSTVMNISQSKRLDLSAKILRIKQRRLFENFRGRQFESLPESNDTPETGRKVEHRALK